MERLDKIIVCETDKGNYAVRPLNWAGYWDKDGKIKESGLNHIAVFHYKEDAEWYAETKNAEEQGLLLRLPCPIGTTVYSFDRQIWIDEKGCRDCVYYAIDGSCDYEEEHPACTKVFETKFEFNMRDDFGKTVFLTKEEAEQALKQMGE